MDAKEVQKYKQKLDILNKDYDRNAEYYCGKNPTITQDINKDKHGMVKAQDRRIPLPIARKLINTVVGFQFSDIQYKETGKALSNQVTFKNLISESKKEIDVTEETDYFKYFKSVNSFNDSDILDLQIAIEACNQGRAYKIYYFADEMLKCDIVPAKQILPVYTDTLNPVLEKAIRFYCEEIGADDKDKKYYVEVYTPQGIESYIAKKSDYSDMVQNPDKPSIVYSQKGIPQKIHVIEYNIFRDKHPLIAHAYGMIDEADRIISKNIAEELAGFKAAILKLSSVLDDTYRDEQGQTALDRFQKSNILQNLSKDDIAEWMTKNIQDSFIFGSYDRLKKDIFELCDIPNFGDAESWGNTISGVSAGYRLLGFLFLCNQCFRIWQEGKRQEIDLINAYVDLLSGGSEVKATINELEIKSNRMLPKNVLENAQIAGMLKDIIPTSDLIRMFPEIVSNPDQAVKELEEQKERETNRLVNGLSETKNTGDNNNGMSDKEKTNQEEITTGE